MPPSTPQCTRAPGERCKGPRSENTALEDSTLGNTLPEPLSQFRSAKHCRSVGARPSTVLSLRLLTHQVLKGRGGGGGRGEGHQRQPSFLHGGDLSEPPLGARRGTSPGTHPRSPLLRLPGPPPPFFLTLWLNFLSEPCAGAQRLSLRPAHWLPCTGAGSFLSPEPTLALWSPPPFALN